MSEKQNNIHDDEFFKDAASLYIDKLGEDLLKEMASVNSLPIPSTSVNRVSEKIKAKRRAPMIMKMSAILVPAAACAALFIIYFTLPAMNSASPRPEAAMASQAPSAVIASETAEAQLLSASLPVGFNLTKTAMDNGKMICYIKSADNDIVLVMEEWQNIDPSRPMTQLDVNGTPMYALQMNDYSLLTYKKGDLRFTLTSPYDYRDLIVIGGALA